MPSRNCPGKLGKLVKWKGPVQKFIDNSIYIIEVNNFAKSDETKRSFNLSIKFYHQNCQATFDSFPRHFFSFFATNIFLPGL